MVQSRGLILWITLKKLMRKMRMTDLLQAKLIIYVMTSSILKINPQYFSDEALDAIAKHEVQLLKNLSEVLDEDLTLNELIINVFDKERFH